MGKNILQLITGAAIFAVGFFAGRGSAPDSEIGRYQLRDHMVIDTVTGTVYLPGGGKSPLGDLPALRRRSS